MISRIEPSLVPTEAKPKTRRKPGAKRERPSNPAPKRNVTKLTATFGVVFMAVLSALLNGHANAQHATIPWAGWAMGMAVPIIVLTLGKVAGDMYRKKQMMVAVLNGGSGLALLFLSVYHCSESISLLTGCSLGLAFPQAVAVDFGLISCEIAVISEAKMALARSTKPTTSMTPASPLS